MLFLGQALSSISKNASGKMNGVIPELVKFIIKNIHDLLPYTDSNADNFDFDFMIVISELFEYYLSTIDTLINGCPIDMGN